MLKDKEGDRWRSNMIILRKRYDLSKVDTFKFLMECGADIYDNDDNALCIIAGKGYLDVVKFLVENGANIHAEDEFALKWSTRNGYFSVANYLISKSSKNLIY